MNDVLVIPNLRAAGRRAGHNLLEGKIMPLVLFLVFLKLAGTAGALIAALAWSVSAICYRVSTRRRVPGLVVLSAVGLTAKTIAALASGSLVVYFLQPTISTALVGAAFLISVPVGRPLAEKLAHDFCPFEPGTASHPDMRRFFVRLSLLWSVTSLVNATLTLWLLLTQPVTTFVIVKSFLGPGFTALTVIVAVGWFRRTLRRKGVRLEYQRSAVAGDVLATTLA
ncbi:MAG TPA: VC0807 family protein [Acidimicrobiales bacterium]|nr:VC0807 family protein [Acidimicrobiales bacterium]